MRYPLPYAFARTHQLLLVQDDANQLTLCLHAESGASGLSEVMRKYPVQQIETLAAAVLIQRISAAYAQGESSAAAPLVASRPPPGPPSSLRKSRQ